MVRQLTTNTMKVEGKKDFACSPASGPEHDNMLQYMIYSYNCECECECAWDWGKWEGGNEAFPTSNV